MPEDEKQGYIDQVVNSMPSQDGIQSEEVSVTGNRKGHAYAGFPISNKPLKLLENIAFTVGYDEVEMNPAWVC